MNAKGLLAWLLPMLGFVGAVAAQHAVAQIEIDTPNDPLYLPDPHVATIIDLGFGEASAHAHVGSAAEWDPGVGVTLMLGAGGREAFRVEALRLVPPFAHVVAVDRRDHHHRALGYPVALPGELALGRARDDRQRRVGGPRFPARLRGGPAAVGHVGGRARGRACGG